MTIKIIFAYTSITVFVKTEICKAKVREKYKRVSMQLFFKIISKTSHFFLISPWLILLILESLLIKFG